MKIKVLFSLIFLSLGLFFFLLSLQREIDQRLFGQSGNRCGNCRQNSLCNNKGQFCEVFHHCRDQIPIIEVYQCKNRRWVYLYSQEGGSCYRNRCQVTPTPSPSSSPVECRGGTFTVYFRANRNLLGGESVICEVTGQGNCSSGGLPCRGASKNATCQISPGEDNCQVTNLDCQCKPFSYRCSGAITLSGIFSRREVFNGGSRTVSFSLPSPTPSSSVTPSPTSTLTPTSAPTPTFTPTPTQTLTQTSASTPNQTPTPTPTQTPSPSPTQTTTPTPTQTPTPTLTPTPTQTPTPTRTPTPTPTLTPTPTFTLTPSPTPNSGSTVSFRLRVSPSLTLTPTPSPTRLTQRNTSPTPTPQPTFSPSPTLTPSPTEIIVARIFQTPTPTQSTQEFRPITSPTSRPTIQQAGRSNVLIFLVPLAIIILGLLL